MMDGEAIHEGVNEAAPTEPLSWKQAYVNDDGTEDEEEEGDEVDDPEDAVEVKEEDEDDVVDEDFILLWGEHKRVITGSDILGRLLRGIAQRRPDDEHDKPTPPTESHHA